MAKAKTTATATAKRAAVATVSSASGGDLSFTVWLLAIMEAKDTRDLSAIASLLRDPTTPMTQDDREALAELLVPAKKGAKVKAKLQGRGGRGGKGGTAARDLAFYKDLASYRAANGGAQTPAEVRDEIAVQYGLHDYDTVRSAERRGKALYDAEREAHQTFHNPPKD